ncbi:flagellar protein FlgN [Shewanella sp. VB17]|uniref:flagellar protein FlgN n=1 Tax=Shewanella sp. VB17 TaxID=2739432 RepID=UPI0020B7B34F|nr:flagellar protein FlgN [Shewanella sp. VB17]
MTSKRKIVQDIIRGIHQDIEDYKQLKILILRQRELMQRRDNSGLERHNSHQSSVCRQLQARADKRSQELMSLGFAGDAHGIELLITKLPTQLAKQMETLWHSLLLLVKESQAVNDDNGNLLVDQQTVISGLLNRHKEVNIDYGMHIPS